MVTVYIPTPFRRATGQRDRVEVEAEDVGGLLEALERAHGGLKGLVRNDRGEVHGHVAIYVNREPIESRQGLATALADGDEVAIIPALAGGGSASRAGASGEASL
ncbi:MAG TPA: MoaD/ThiS family protein [Methylomirabilota bacterium]|nr:MoaD/ThiS family protein [Methylomirabilota bacterium]